MRRGLSGCLLFFLPATFMVAQSHLLGQPDMGIGSRDGGKRKIAPPVPPLFGST